MVIQITILQINITYMKLTLGSCVGSSDNPRCDPHFTKLLPLVPFWVHTSAMLGAYFLTKRHLGHLGFDPAPHNHHAASLFGELT